MHRQIKGVEIVEENELIGGKEIRKKASKKGGSLSSKSIFPGKIKRRLVKLVEKLHQLKMKEYRTAQGDDNLSLRHRFKSYPASKNKATRHPSQQSLFC